MSNNKTAIITGASGGIGVGLVQGFFKQGFNVVGTSLNSSQSLTASPSIVLLDGDIGKQETAAKAVEAAIKRFGTVDVLVNNAGIFRKKPFTGLYYRGLQRLGPNQPPGIPLHHSTRSETDAETKIGECRDHFSVTCRPTDRGHKRLGLDDYEGGTKFRYPESRDRVRERRHPL